MERKIKPEVLKTELSTKFVLDVRRNSDLAASCEQLPGANWRDPDKLDDWADALPRDRDIILYCVRGGSVSNAVVDALQSRGLNARFIEGGIEGWKAAGGDTETRT